MAPKICALCGKSRAILKRPKTGQQICKECFFYVFETEVHNTVTQAQLFKPGDRVAIGASGGKGMPNVLRCRVACLPFRSPWQVRFDGPGVRHENSEREIRLRYPPVSLIHRRRYHRLQG